MPYRVDNVPLLLRPLLYLYAYGFALAFHSVRLLFHLTFTIEKEGEEHPAPYGNHIYATWHENLLCYFTVYIRYRERYAWINHPLWYMKPVHIVLRWMGMRKLFLGSSGHGGREAMLQVVEHLKKGYNTFINPDGPAGPYQVLKPGVLEMSRLSGIPVVPIRFELSKYIRWRGWDKKKMPLPFSTIKVIYQKPVLVTDLNFQEAAREIAAELG